MRATDTRFLDLVDHSLRQHRIGEGAGDPPEGTFPFSADCGLARVMAGGREARPVATLYMGTLPIYRGGDLDEMTGRLVSACRDLVTNVQDEYIRIRAGAVALDGGVLVLPSLPERHLPALIALLVQRGARYLGDELVKIEPILRRIHGMPLPILVDVEDIAGLGLDRETRTKPPRAPRARRSQPIEAMTPRRAVPLTQLDGVMAEPAAASWLVFPTFETGAPVSLQPIGSADALFRLVEGALNLDVWADRGLRLFTELLAEVPAYRMVVGSLRDAADLLVQCVEQGFDRR